MRAGWCVLIGLTLVRFKKRRSCWHLSSVFELLLKHWEHPPRSSIGHEPEINSWVQAPYHFNKNRRRATPDQKNSIVACIYGSVATDFWNLGACAEVGVDQNFRKRTYSTRCRSNLRLESTIAYFIDEFRSLLSPFHPERGPDRHIRSELHIHWDSPFTSKPARSTGKHRGESW